MTPGIGRPAVVGRVARAEICLCGRSVLLSLGPLSIRLDEEAAGDVAATLTLALSALAADRGDAQAPGGRAPASEAADPEDRN